MSSGQQHHLFAQIQLVPEIAELTAAVGGGLETPVYLVGGSVRDVALGQRPVDVDVCVEGEIDALLERLGGSQQVHTRFGTATVQRGELRFDIAQARSESYSAPGALPAVQPATIAHDLERRDFTVNAIAVCLNAERSGMIVAFPGAFTDLEARQLQVLHERAFVDDPTRLFRLARYASRLRFTIAARTDELAREAVAGGAVGTLSGTRVGNELRLLLSEADPIDALTTVAALGLDTAICEGFGLAGLAAVAQDALALLPDDGRRDLVVLTVAALELALARLKALLDELGFTAADRDLVVHAVRGAQTLSARLRAATKPSAIAAAVNGASIEAVAVAGALGGTQPASEWLGRLRRLRLAIDGDDLVGAGVAPGPAIGAGLAAARAAMLDREAPDREAQLRIALATARAG